MHVDMPRLPISTVYHSTPYKRMSLHRCVVFNQASVGPPPPYRDDSDDHVKQTFWADLPCMRPSRASVPSIQTLPQKHREKSDFSFHSSALNPTEAKSAQTLFP